MPLTTYRNNSVLKNYRALAASGASDETLAGYVKEQEKGFNETVLGAPFLLPHAIELRSALRHLHQAKMAETFAKEGDALATKKDFVNASLKYSDAATLVVNKPMLLLRYTAAALGHDVAAIKASDVTDHAKVTEVATIWWAFRGAMLKSPMHPKLRDQLATVEAPNFVRELPAAYAHLEKSFATVRQWTIANDPDTRPALAVNLVRMAAKAAVELAKRTVGPKPPQPQTAQKPGQSPEA